MFMLDNYSADVVRVEELCRILRLGKNSVYDLLKKGKIKNLRVGKKYIIPKKSVIEFLDIA